MKNALDFLTLQSFLNRELEDKQKEAVIQILCGGNLLTILPKGFGKSLVFQMVRLDRPCDLPVEKHCGAKRFLKVQAEMSNLKSPQLHPDLYAKFLFHWDVVFKTSNNFITLKLKSYKTFSEHSSFFSRYKRMTMYRVQCK